MSESNVHYKILGWSEVRDELRSHSKDFVDIIDKIAPEDTKYRLYKLSYHFGNHIIKDGKLCLPTSDKKSVPFDSSHVPKSVFNDLAYNDLTCPSMIVMKNGIELFVRVDSDRIIPFLVMKPGDQFGTWKILDRFTREGHKYLSHPLCHSPHAIWDMTAGARSLFILPKISEAGGHYKLQKKYGIKTDKPKDYTGHWALFSELYNSPNFDEEWTTDVLFFSRSWFENLNDPAWKDLKLYLLDENWKYSEYWRNQFTRSMAFSRVHEILGITPNHHYSDIVSHLLTLAAGALPGFEIANSDDLGPLSKIQDIYKNEYGLLKPPLIMQPGFFNEKYKDKVIYYSLQHPTALELSPKSNRRASVLTDTFMVKSLFDKYCRVLSKINIGINESPLVGTVENISFNFHHPHIEDYPTLADTEQLNNLDLRLMQETKKLGYDTSPVNSTFFKGCVSIRNTLV